MDRTRHLALVSLLLSGCPSAVPADAGFDTIEIIDAAPEDAGSDAPRPDAQIDRPTGDPLTWDETARGPFRVGYRQFPLTYTPRGQTSPRNISVHIWYPTLAASGAFPRYAEAFQDRDVIVDAPVAAPAHADGFPLVVHSHGWRGFPGASWPTLGRLASHGFVVVMPSHTDSTLTQFMDPRPTAHYYERSLDVSASVDAIAALPASDMLSRTVTGQYVLLGHSFGVHTVWASVGATFDVDAIRARCMPAGTCTEAELAVFAEGVRDPRIVAAMPIAGSIDDAWFGANGFMPVRVPMLSMTGTADGVDGMAQQARVSPPVPLDWVSVDGACHNSFAVPTLACATADAEVVNDITATYALAFARVHLLDDPDDGIITGMTSVHSTAHFVGGTR
jgi:predicted dienelactone hydrolase